MKPFALDHAASADAALAALGEGATAIAGGTNLVDLMKLQVATPERLVSIRRTGLDRIAPDADGLRIGALVTNADCAADARVRQDWPLLSQAILAGASPQLRNRATTGGNLCQRTRCGYFYDTTQACNKREAGSGCAARDGFNRIHAVLGTSDACIATYPGDMAVALLALDAVVLTQGPYGPRQIPLAMFHREPGDDPTRDNVLQPGELITAVRLPAPTGGRQIYRKVRDRASYAFALVSVAVDLTMEEGRIARCALAFGSLGTVPWRDPAVEEVLWAKSPRPPVRPRCRGAAAPRARLWRQRFQDSLPRAPWPRRWRKRRRVDRDAPSLSEMYNEPDDRNVLDHMRQGVIGQPLDRPEGALKVSGQATYAAEWRIDGCVEGVLVLAEIAQGQVTAIDRDAALARDGVLAVIADPAMTRRSAQGMAAKAPQQDAGKVEYFGQPVALVVAQTFEQARDAALRCAWTMPMPQSPCRSTRMRRT
jgi:xanthine dehydrogenase YagS FAD-binding subunit